MDQIDSNDDRHDVEAVLSLPDENESSAIEEEHPRSSFGRRKKAVLAVVSIVVVAAIAVGVAVAVKPNGQPLDRAGVTQIASPVEGDAIDAAPSEELDNESFQVPLRSESSRDEASDLDQAGATQTAPVEGDAIDAEPSGLDNESFVAPLPNESPQETPQEVVDGEAPDIIINEGYDAEHPQDIIYDAGSEQREEAEELDPREIVAPADKVRVDGEDASPEVIDFDGPITDFIVTSDMARTTVTTSSVCPDRMDGVWRITLETDNYPWETYWELRDMQDNVLAFGPPTGRNYARSTKYIGQMCFRQGWYKMVLGDKSNDGLCCEYGQGKMEIKANGNVVAESDDSNFDVVTYSFRIPRANDNSDATPPPTKSPTDAPTPNPTPTPNPVKPTNPASVKCVDIEVSTDGYGRETGYTFTDLQTNTIILRKNKREMANYITYTDSICVVDGQYQLTVEDLYNGIEENGYYSVTVDGVEVMYGKSFSGGSATHIIHVGYVPAMTNRDRQWLEAHNNRRRDYYLTAGLPDKPLVWSEQLAQETSNWVDEILPLCRILRQPNLAEGENMSARSSNFVRDEGPEAILSRWSESKADQPYPLNQSRSQVLWRGSRFVGCSEKSVQRANGTYCYVSICRYLRAGNCNMGVYTTGSFVDWEAAALTDRTSCKPECPGNTCY